MFIHYMMKSREGVEPEYQLRSTVSKIIREKKRRMKGDEIIETGNRLR